MEAARVAGEGDLARLAALTRMAVEEARARRGGPALVGRWVGLTEADLQQGLAAVLTADERCLWAGTIDGAVVGAALADAVPGGAGRLSLLFVEPEARGVGVGETMLEAATAWLGERGSATVDVSVLPGDRDTKQFCEGAGMVARLLVMSRAL